MVKHSIPRMKLSGKSLFFPANALEASAMRAHVVGLVMTQCLDVSARDVP